MRRPPESKNSCNIFQSSHILSVKKPKQNSGRVKDIFFLVSRIFWCLSTLFDHVRSPLLSSSFMVRKSAFRACRAPRARSAWPTACSAPTAPRQRSPATGLRPSGARSRVRWPTSPRRRPRGATACSRPRRSTRPIWVHSSQFECIDAEPNRQFFLSSISDSFPICNQKNAKITFSSRLIILPPFGVDLAVDHWHRRQSRLVGHAQSRQLSCRPLLCARSRLFGVAGGAATRPRRIGGQAMAAGGRYFLWVRD